MSDNVTSNLAKMDEHFRIRLHIDKFKNLQDPGLFLDNDAFSYMIFGSSDEILIFSSKQVEDWRKTFDAKRKHLSPKRLPGGEFKKIDLFLSSLVEFKLLVTSNQVTIPLPKMIRNSRRAPKKGAHIGVVANDLRFELWPLDDLFDQNAEMANEILSLDIESLEVN